MWGPFAYTILFSLFVFHIDSDLRGMDGWIDYALMIGMDYDGWIPFVMQFTEGFCLVLEFSLVILVSPVP